MGQIFISYARDDDEPFVKQLYQDLTENGIDVWWDRKAMESRGRTFLQELRDAIEASDRLIAIIGPNAVKSDYVRAEWEHALLFSRGVVPILREGDYSQIPDKLSKFHCPDFRRERPYNEALEELLRILAEPVPPLGPLLTAVPFLPPHFLSRHDEITRLWKTVLADVQRPTVITSARQTTALQGMGGVGKSVMATAFARATETRHAFTDGVIWLTIGQDPDPSSNLLLVGTAFGDDPANYVDLDTARARLPRVLSDKVCLIVLDDVWNVAHATPFVNALGPRCRLLITTRDGSLITALGAQEHSLDVLTDAAALQLLANWCDQDVESLPSEAVSVANECGNLPLALALCGAMARDGTPWSDMLEALEEADLTFIEGKIPNYPYTDVLKALKVSIDALVKENLAAAEHYHKLAVFPADEAVPEAAVLTFWLHTDGLKERDARKLLTTLERKALMRLEGEAPHRLVSLHDLQHDYLRVVVGDLSSLHSQLLEAYQQKCADGWKNGPNDGYFFEHLAYHLVEAGREDELRGMLLDFDWLQAKIAATDVNSLIADYNHLPDDSDLKLVQGAIRLSAHVLASDKEQLACQLLGRLQSFQEPKLQLMLEHTCKNKSGMHLHPLTASLRHPGGPLMRTLVGHTSSVLAVALTTNCSSIVSASDDHKIKIWDVESGQELKTLTGHSRPVKAVAITTDFRHIVSASDDWTIKIWDMENGQELKTLKGHKGSVYGVAITPNEQFLISSSFDRTIKIWDMESGKKLKTLKGHNGPVKAVAITADCRRIVSASDDNTLKIWDMESGQELKTLKGHKDWVLAVAITHDDQRIISTSYDSTIKIWDMESGRKLKTHEIHNFPVYGVVVIDERRAASVSHDWLVKVWEMESGRVLKTLKDHFAPVSAVAIAADCRRIVSASIDCTVKVWDIESDQESHTPGAHAKAVHALAMTSDGKRVISASYDNTLKIWDIESGQELHTLKGHGNAVHAIAVTHDCQRIVSASFDNTLKVWNIESGQELHTLKGHTKFVVAITVTHDCQCAISASYDNTLKIWDIISGQELHTLKGHSGEVTAVAVTLDDRSIISASVDNTIKVWDTKSGQVRLTLSDHNDSVLSVSVTSDGLRIISASVDNTIKVWDAKSGQVMFTLSGHTGAVNAIAMTLDGQRIISASDDKTLKMWDVENGQELKTLKGHRDAINEVSITANGYLISASKDNMIKVWDVENGEIISTFTGDSSMEACAVSPNGLTVIAAEALGRVHFLRLVCGIMHA